MPADVVTEFLRRGALARALAMAGTMERVLALVVEHTSARTQFGRAVGKFQAVQPGNVVRRLRRPCAFLVVPATKKAHGRGAPTE